MRVWMLAASMLTTALLQAAPLMISGSPTQGTVGVAYSFTFTAAGGTAPYTFSAGTLPGGLTLSAAGVVSGTPAAPVQNLPVGVQVRDGAGAAASTTVLFQVGTALPAAPLAVSANPLPPPTIGIAYSQTFTASGGTLPYSFWSLANGTLPPGLNFSGAIAQGNLIGLLSGTPTASGNFAFTIQVTDSRGAIASRAITLVVSNFTITSGGAEVPDLTGTSYSPMPAGTVASPYNQTLQATGGTLPYTFSLAGGSLPPGLSLGGSGAFVGSPTITGTYTFTVQATDGAGLTTQKNLSIQVFAPGAQFVTATLPNATVGVAYSQTIQVTAGRAPYVFSVSNGSLPAGLTLSGAGVISGIATAPAFNAVFTVQVLDGAGVRSTGTFTLTATPPALTITTASLPAASLAVPYSQALTASGGIPPYQFGFVSGNLSSGFSSVSISPAGVITGTPSRAGTYTFDVGVLDTPGSSGFNISSAQKSFTIVVGAAAPPAFTTPATLPAGQTGTAYNQTLALSGGNPPYVLSLATGALPGGLALSGAGALTGTPTAAGNFTFAVMATDASAQTVSQAFTLRINAAIVISTAAALPGGTVGAPYSQAINAAGGTPPFTYSVAAGAVPGGLTVNSAGVLSGTPVASGTFNFTVQAVDSSAGTASQSFALTIVPAALTISNAPTLPAASVDAPYSLSFAATGGTPPYSYSLIGGALTNGLSLSSGGVLSGSPGPAGTTTFTVAVADGASLTAAKAFSLTVNPSPIVIATPATLPGATSGVPYAAVFAATGGTGSGLGFTAPAGSAPPGLAFDTRSLSGTPTAAGTYTFTLTFADSGSTPVSKAFTLLVNPPGLAIATLSPLPNGTLGAGYSQMLAAAGGTAPYRFSLVSGSLPTGLALSAAGLLSGTPSAPGAFNFSVQVADAAGATASQTFSIAVAANPFALTTLSLAGGKAGTAYTQTISVTGGVPPVTFLVTQGTLPSGLSLGSSTGLIGGTPTAPGTFSFTVQATDSAGTLASAAFSIAIIPAGLTISPVPPLPNGAVSSPYTVALSAVGGSPPYAFTVMSGSLPTGLTMSPTGLIGGTPTAAGLFNFVVQASDAAGQMAAMSYSIAIAANGFVISTGGALPPAVVGTPYSLVLQASGGTAPYTFATSDPLPPGLTLTPSGVLSGTPTAPGTFSFTVTGADSGAVRTLKAFQITVSQPGGVSFTSQILAGGSVGSLYSQTLAAQGGAAPYKYAVTGGSLPQGLTLTPAGLLTGTPTSAGVFTVTILVTDAAGLTAMQQFSLLIAASGLAISPATLPPGAAGIPYSQFFTAVGGAAPYTYAVIAGTLPPGLTLTAVGTLGGVPSAGGIFPFTVQATDGAGKTGTQSYSLGIGAPALMITRASLPPGSAGTVYNQALTATGGTAPFTWILASGTLPGGLTLGMDGVLSGTPVVPETFAFTVQVIDALAMSASQAYTVVIAAAAQIPSVAAIVNAASYQTGPVAPGEIVTIFGSRLGPAILIGGQTIAQTRVLFDGVAAPLLYASATQVSAIVPYAVAGQASTALQVEYLGARSQAINLAVTASAPGVFSANASGQGPGAILNQDFSLNTASNPAAADSVVILYLTGEGQTAPAGVDGKIAGDVPLPKPILGVTATIGGLPADVLYAGAAPGIVAGGMQVNLKVPMGILAASPVAVVVTVGSAPSQAGVTVAIR